MSDTVVGNAYLEILPKMGADGTSMGASFGNAFGDGMKGAVSAASVALGNIIASGVSAAGRALSSFVGGTVEAGRSFDEAMAQVAATMGGSIADMESQVETVGDFTGNLADFAQKMGAETGFSATQAAEALNYMALAGYDAKTSMETLPSVLDLATAGSMDLARASDMVTDTQTAFGISLERTGQMVDEMAKAAATGNTSVEQLGDAFLTVGGLAQELNGGLVALSDGTVAEVDGIQELEIALTAMANAGVKGTEAGTHMRNMLLKLASPTSEGVETMEALGVSVFDAAGNMRSLSSIFGDLDGALSTLTQEQKIEAISALFNTRDLASAEALLNAVGQDWDGIGEAILDAQGAAALMAATQFDSLEGDVTMFQSALEGVQIALFHKVEPAMRSVVKVATNALGGAKRLLDRSGAIPFVDTLAERLPAMKGSLSAFASAAKSAASAVAEPFARIGSAFGAFSPALESLGRSVASFFDGVAQSTGTPLALLRDAAEGAMALLDGFADKLEGALLPVADKASEALEDLHYAANDFGAILSTAVLDRFSEVSGFVTGTALPALSSFASGLGEHVLSPLLEVGSVLGGELLSTIGGLTSYIRDYALPALGDFASTVAERIAPALEAAGGALSSNFMSALGELVVFIVRHKVETFEKVMDFVIGTVLPALEDLAGMLGDKFPDALDVAAEFVTGTALPALETLSDIVGGALAGAFEVVGAFVTDTVVPAFEALSQILSGKVGESADDTADRFSGTLGPAFEAVSGFVEDHIMPMLGDLAGFLTDTLLPDLVDLGEWCEEHVVPMFTDHIIPMVGDLAAGFVDNLVPALESAYGFFKDYILPILRNVAEFFTDTLVPVICDTVVPAIGDFAKTAGEVLGPVLEGLFGIVRDVSDVAFPLLSAGFKAITGDGDGARESLSQAADAIGEKLGFPGLSDKVRGLFANVRDFMEDPVGNAAEALKGFADDICEKLGFPGLGGLVEGVFQDIQGFMEDPVGNAVEFLRGIPDEIIGFFAGIGDRISEAFGSISFPTPHVTWEALSIAGMDTPISLPHVDWYAQGGIVDDAALIGAGERGPELVWPSYEPYLSKYADAIAEGIGQKGGVTIEINNPVVRETADVDRILEYANSRLRRSGAAALC